MGKMLGAHDPNAVIDRPDLNKCPECECFFGSLNCPLCGKPCPEEMRAGNRKPVKIKKQKNTGTGRVTFVEWYHSWWFIILMLFIFPLAGICLLVTSPHKKWAKILLTVLFVLYTVGTTFGFGIVFDLFEGDPVDSSLTQEEYIAACETVSPEVYFRSADSYDGAFVAMNLRVVKKITAFDEHDYDSYITYYLCNSADGSFEFLLRDCFLGDVQNLASGDSITVYGEGAGSLSITSANYEAYSAPVINGAYVEIKN